MVLHSLSRVAPGLLALRPKLTADSLKPGRLLRVGSAAGHDVHAAVLCWCGGVAFAAPIAGWPHAPAVICGAVPAEAAESAVLLDDSLGASPDAVDAAAEEGGVSVIDCFGAPLDSPPTSLRDGSRRHRRHRRPHPRGARPVHAADGRAGHRQVRRCHRRGDCAGGAAAALRGCSFRPGRRGCPQPRGMDLRARGSAGVALGLRRPPPASAPVAPHPGRPQRRQRVGESPLPGPFLDPSWTPSWTLPVGGSASEGALVA
ncbi:hypothetical protein EMIHUDRAFT_445446, partial [Emiliania huxleyi CCMP1516]|uniref:Uncharacterized protein n=2 Tax=Emiliania huxleyi TaxID=2903 RepID=A0A0D3IY51_EMIH1